VSAALSAAFALNLYLPFGVHGAGPPPLVMSLTIFDPGVIVALVVCASLVWLAVVLERECASDPPGWQ
jgi:hypothetical protein